MFQLVHPDSGLPFDLEMWNRIALGAITITLQKNLGVHVLWLVRQGCSRTQVGHVLVFRRKMDSAVHVVGAFQTSTHPAQLLCAGTSFTPGGLEFRRVPVPTSRAQDVK
jgi:hypothetical protein